jgi:folate-binding protein YgfZ
MSIVVSNLLNQSHETAGAEFQSYAGIEIVSTFGEPQIEYAALHKGCGKMDLAHRGILRATGEDRLDFLNRFLTNELINKETKTPIKSGQGVYAYLLNNKGRVIADMNVLERGDHTLIETDARNVPNIQTVLQKYIFSERIQFAVDDQTHEIALHGPTSLQVLKKVLPDFSELPILGSTQVRLGSHDVTIWRDDPCGVPSYFLLTPSSATAEIWNSIIQIGRPIGWAAFNSVRIEAGRPLFGIDFDDTVLPAETGDLNRAVSFTKGCYLGQEIVARMHARGQAARQIVGIRMAESFLPMAGVPIFDDQKNQIGLITSSTLSPILSNASIALGMVKKPFAAPGAVLHIPAEGSVRIGNVVELPFVKDKKQAS